MAGYTVSYTALNSSNLMLYNNSGWDGSYQWRAVAANWDTTVAVPPVSAMAVARNAAGAEVVVCGAFSAGLLEVDSQGAILSQPTVGAPGLALNVSARHGEARSILAVAPGKISGASSYYTVFGGNFTAAYGAPSVTAIARTLGTGSAVAGVADVATAVATIGLPERVESFVVDGADVYAIGRSLLLNDQTTPAGGVVVYKNGQGPPTPLADAATQVTGPLTAGATCGLVAGSGSSKMLLVGGSFTPPQGANASLHAAYVMGYNLASSAWSTLRTAGGAAGGVANGGVADMLAMTDDSVYMVGEFNMVSGLPGRVARFTPSTGAWAALAADACTSNTCILRSMARETDDSFLVAGAFEFAGGQRVARYTISTNAFTAVGAASLPEGPIFAVAVTASGFIVVGGLFDVLSAGGAVLGKNVARYDAAAAAWTTLASGAITGLNRDGASQTAPATAYVTGITRAPDGSLFFTGPFSGWATAAGGSTAVTKPRGVARWNGRWEPVATNGAAPRAGAMGDNQARVGVVPAQAPATGFTVWLGGNWATLDDGTTVVNRIAKATTA
jgi:hypothetical protein